MAELNRLNSVHWLTLLFICFFGLVGCIVTDNSTIDESSIVITQGIIRDDFVVIYIDANATGLEGYDTVLPDKETGFHHIHEMGYTMFYEVYNPQGVLVEKRSQDMRVYDPVPFSKKELTIPNPQWWSEDNPVEYTLILRLMIVNKPLFAVTKKFRLEKVDSLFRKPEHKEDAVPYNLCDVKPTFQGGTLGDFSFWVVNHMEKVDISGVIPTSVNVRVLLAENGQILDVVGTGNHPDSPLTIAFIKAAKDAPKWTPASKDGAPCKVVIDIPVHIDYRLPATN